jgi:hypothetical protein
MRELLPFFLMKPFRPFLAVLAICAILGGTVACHHGGASKPLLYIALFRISVGEDSKLHDFHVIKVIDLLSGSNNAANIELPQAFFDEARKEVEAEHLKPTNGDGEPTNTLASFLYCPADQKDQSAGISFHALDGAMNTTSDFRLLGQNAAVSTFGAHAGRSAFFVSYYALLLPKGGKDQREAIVEAELQRSAANVQGAAVLSRKNLSTDSQTIIEFTCKSPQNKALTIRSRYLCNDRQMLAFTAITPDALPAGDAHSFDRLFEAFRFY